jgi:hypothetical protein
MSHGILLQCCLFNTEYDNLSKEPTQKILIKITLVLFHQRMFLSYQLVKQNDHKLNNNC